MHQRKRVGRLTVDEVGYHDTNSDHDLEQTSDTTANFLRGAFRDICGRDRGDGANSYASDDPTSVDVAKPS